MRFLSFPALLGTLLMSLGTLNAQAAVWRFYDPSNAASPTGKTIGYELVRTIGCPGREQLGVPCQVPDSDADGVYDEADKCPATPAGRKVNVDGCEPDGDGDGVADAVDKCPATPAGRKVNADGCELDSDGDGVVDGIDACPTVPAQTADGCPPPAPVAAPAPVVAPVVAPVAAPAPAVALPATLVLIGVTFDNNQATLRPDAIAILDRAAVTLQQWGNIKVEVAGYTDATGSRAVNERLSLARAESVRAFLIAAGVPVDRLTARGYGPANPVASNATPAGRELNRRVELRRLD